MEPLLTGQRTAWPKLPGKKPVWPACSVGPSPPRVTTLWVTIQEGYSTGMATNLRFLSLEIIMFHRLCDLPVWEPVLSVDYGMQWLIIWAPPEFKDREHRPEYLCRGHPQAFFMARLGSNISKWGCTPLGVHPHLDIFGSMIGTDWGKCWIGLSPFCMGSGQWLPHLSIHPWPIGATYLLWLGTLPNHGTKGRDGPRGEVNQGERSTKGRGQPRGEVNKAERWTKGRGEPRGEVNQGEGQELHATCINTNSRATRLFCLFVRRKDKKPKTACSVVNSILNSAFLLLKDALQRYIIYKPSYVQSSGAEGVDFVSLRGNVW